MAVLPFSYCSFSDVYEAIPYVSSVSDVSSLTVGQHGGMSQALVNAKLAQVYTVPFNPAPPLIQMITCHITCWYLLAGSTILAASLKDSPWPKTYKDAFDVLDKVANQEISLVTSSGTIIDARTDQVQLISNNSGYTPTFSELGVDWANLDPDKKQDLEDERI